MSTKEVAVQQQGGALAMPSGVMAALAAEAKEAAAKERPAVGIFSTQSGVLSYSGTPVPGNKVEVVVLAAAFRNVFYAGKFDRNNIVPPNCFSLSEDDKDMAPHENVAEPVHPTCDGCPNDAWGSDPNGGRGKACKQSRRLVMLPADCVDKDEAAIMQAEFAKMDIPVTSVKNYSSFVNVLSATAGVPPYAAVTEISVVPDLKTQFKVVFRPMRVLPTEAALNAVRKRMGAAVALSTEPYEETATAASAAAAAAAAAPASSKGKKF